MTRNLSVLRLKSRHLQTLRFCSTIHTEVSFFKMGQSRPLFHLFLSFQTRITIFTTNKC